MRTTEQFSITLPIEMAEAVREKVASGLYASDSEVMRAGMRALLAQDEAVERWLRTEVVAALAEHDADPSKAIPADQVMERIRARAAARRNGAGAA